MTRRMPIVKVRRCDRYELLHLGDKELADMGLSRSILGGANHGLLIVRLGDRQHVMGPSRLRGLVSAAGVALLLVLALLTAERGHSDQIALMSCPLFHPGIMGSASPEDAGPASSSASC